MTTANDDNNTLVLRDASMFQFLCFVLPWMLAAYVALKLMKEPPWLAAYVTFIACGVVGIVVYGLLLQNTNVGVRVRCDSSGIGIRSRLRMVRYEWDELKSFDYNVGTSDSSKADAPSLMTLKFTFRDGERTLPLQFHPGTERGSMLQNICDLAAAECAKK